MFSLLIALAAAASAQGPAAAGASGAAHVQLSTEAFVSPSTATFAEAAGIVGEVHIRRVNVFDPEVPGEDWWPFRLANRIHVPTRDEVVRRELLLEPGQRYDALDALESERNLRFTGFIRRAEVRPRPAPGGRLDLDVLTQDAWTLAPQVSVGTEGGDRFFIWGVEEKNLLGFGKLVSLYHSQVGPSRRGELRYRDPRLAGTRQRLTTLYAQTPKGDEVGALVDRPFFELHSPYSLHLLWARINQEDVLYRDAEDYSKFIQSFRAVQASGGLRLTEDQDPVQRVLLGFQHQRDRFDPTADTRAGTLPAGREMTGPVLGYSLIQPRFVKETYIDRFERVEDFNLGNELAVSGGPALSALGSDRDRWLLSVLDQQGLRISEGRFLLGQAGLTGRLAGGKVENGLAYGNLNLFWKTLWPLPQTWVVHAELNAARALDGENQLILGGGTGLRGYKNDSFTGSKSALLNVENRLFLTGELFHLLRLGAVAFFETGAVAPESGGFKRAGFKSDVGFGLRFSPTRSTTGGALRMDVAYALNEGPGGSRWVFTLRGGQAFQIFNSTNRSVLRTPASTIGEEQAGTRLRKR